MTDSSALPTNGGSSNDFPLAAQIPLQSFTIPIFPPHASHLRELTLTSDVKLDEYQSIVSQPTPDHQQIQLPQSITSLTLELFTLGFPASFLSNLARSLPNLKSLTLFSCLVDGVTDESRKDAEQFFEWVPLLQDLHVIDTYARPGFWKTVSKVFEGRARDLSENGNSGVKVVEISFTYRGHEESDFMGRVGAEELAGLLVAGCVGWSCDFVAPPPSNEGNGDGTGKAPKGVLPFASDGRAADALRRRFENLSGGPLKELRVVNLGMYVLRPNEVGEVIYSCAGGEKAKLVDLTVSVLMEGGWWKALLENLNGNCDELHNLEIVGVPSVTIAEGSDQEKQVQEIGVVFQNESEGLGLLREKCPALTRFQMSMLKAKDLVRMEWVEQEAKWRPL